MMRRSVATRLRLFAGAASALTVVPLLVAAPAAAAGAPEPGTPAWRVMAVEANAHARQRTADLLANPELEHRRLELCAEQVSDDCRWLDPYRLDWAGTRGRAIDVEYRNRYGVPIAGTLSLPLEPGRYPTVVFVNGYGNWRTDYQGIVHGLVEAGYAVLGFDPQCQGHSGCQPSAEFCDPAGSWREPQEFGVTEQGRCAGDPPDPDEGPVTATLRSAEDMAWMATTLAGCRLDECDWEMIADLYPPLEARHILGTVDALDWLLSEDNPHRHEIDDARIGVIGHSAGGHAALVVGNGDERVDAAVSFDSYGRLPSSVEPRVPTLFLHADGQDHGGPYHRPPSPDGPTGLRTTRQFAAAGVDTMALALRGTTHQEFLWIPPEQPHPMLHQSRLGERVALYYTRAWLDRALLDSRAGTKRLLAERFDRSIDGSSIGAGRWDPVARQNVPYTIAGGRTADHLSPFFRSSMAFGGVHCADLRSESCCSATDRSTAPRRPAPPLAAADSHDHAPGQVCRPVARGRV